MKTKLNVYYLETSSRWLTWMDVFLELVLYLQKKYDVNLIHQVGQSLKIPKYDCGLMDCEIVIEDEENDIMRGITFSESRSSMFDNIFVKRNNKNDKVMVTQYYTWFARDYKISDNYNFKVLPTTYYPLLPTTNYSYWYRLRKFSKFENLIDKMFCLYTTNREDVPRLRELGIAGEARGNLTLENYLTLAIQYKIGLSITGVAEICHREFEYMAVGIPNFRLEYMTQLNPPLIPNYHYVSVDRSQFPWDGHKHREGGPEYVEAYMNRFMEVKDDREFLEFIAENGRQYYLENCSDNNRLRHILASLEL